MLVAILTLVLTAGAQAPAGSAAARDEAALRALAAAYIGAHEHEDADALLALWDPAAEAYTSTERMARFVFTKTDYRMANVAVDRIRTDGDRASFRLLADREIEDRRDTGPGGQPIVRIYRGLTAVVLTCARSDNGWRIVGQDDAVGDFADRLIDAGPEERERLFADEPRLISGDLRNALAVRADRLYAAQAFAPAKALLDLALRVATAVGDQEGLAVTYQNLGNVLYLLNDYQASLEYYRMRLALEQERANAAGEASAWHGIATTEYSQGDYLSALESYERALALRERLDPSQQGDLPSLLIGLGNAHFLLHDYRPAIDAYRRAASLLARRSPGELVRAWSGVGRVLAIEGNYREALEAYDRVLTLAIRRRDETAVADALADVANVHSLQRDYRMAADLYTLHRDLLWTLDDRAGVALAELQIGRIELIGGAGDRAEPAFRRGAAIAEAIGDRENQGRALIGLGFALAGLDRFDEAITSYQRARDIFVELKLGEEAGRAWLGLALAYAGAADHGLALEAGQHVVSIASEIGNDDLLWRGQVRRGQASRRLGRPAEALAAFDDAIVVVERARGRAGRTREAAGFTRERAEPYLGRVDVAADEGDARAALTWAERAAAQVRLDLIERSPAPVIKGLSAEERLEEQSLDRAVVSLAGQIERALTRRPVDEARVAALRASLEDTRARLAAFGMRLAGAHPDLPRWRGETAPFAADAIMAAIPAGTVVLQYVVTEDEVRLLAIDRERVEQHLLSISSGDLASRVAPALDPATLGSTRAWRAVAADLYALLLAPAEARLAGATNIVIVPDGLLWRLPFEALAPATPRPPAAGTDRWPPYLVGRAAVSYASSLTAWVYAREVARVRQTDVTPGLLAFAAPPFDVDRAAGMGLTEVFAGLATQLAEEAASAAGAYPSGGHAVHLGGEARESHLWAEAGGVPVLHLAAPGRLDNASPFFSQVALAAAPLGTDAVTPASDDGLAEVWELLGRDHGAGVVICTALGWPASGLAGDAVTSLSWAWLVAGTPSVIVNRWLAPPAVRGPFAAALHGALASRIPRSGPADALRLAMLDTMRAPGFDAPAYWAGFMMVGHPE